MIPLAASVVFAGCAGHCEEMSQNYRRLDAIEREIASLEAAPPERQSAASERAEALRRERRSLLIDNDRNLEKCRPTVKDRNPKPENY
ncbi:MAG: hypothetical protein M3Y08_02275 [Fibrobacterota bacterium]|nr:hypothetical protein [Fibrobacterota bacterium]